jgi:tRNA nucleotidyltransferase/poly(A) polymerase
MKMKQPSQQRWMPEWLHDSLLKIQPTGKTWLVGGAIRDSLLKRTTSDFDFVVEGDSLKIARQLANNLTGDYYVLDRNRKMGRVIIAHGQVEPFHIDFAPLIDSGIERDLEQRDFTINALAVDPGSPKKVIDPCGGIQDLKDKIIRQCSHDSIQNDPIRGYRAIRFAVQFNARIEKQTLENIRKHSSAIEEISLERLRDEFFRILRLSNPGTALRLIDHLNLYTNFAGIFDLPSAPSPESLECRIQRIDRLISLFQMIGGEFEPESSIGLILGEARLRLGKFQDKVVDYLAIEKSQGRTISQLLLLTVLLVSKDDTLSVDSDSSELQGSQMGSTAIRSIANSMRLSSSESNWLGRAIASFQPQILQRVSTQDSIFPFLRRAKDAAPAVVLLALAEFLSQSVLPVDQDRWSAQVRGAEDLLDAYWSDRFQELQHSQYLRGADLMKHLGIEAGPEIGRILEILREAQFMGEINSKEEAIAMARQVLEGTSNEQNQLD